MWFGYLVKNENGILILDFVLFSAFLVIHLKE